MSNLRFLTIDETDRMIEKGHFEELEKILNLIKKFDCSSFSFFFLSLILLVIIKINSVCLQIYLQSLIFLINSFSNIDFRCWNKC